MALKPCKSCKHQVDTTAKTCPNCGVANPGVSAKEQFIAVIILLVIIVVAFKACSGGAEKKEAAAVAPKASTSIVYSITQDEHRPQAPRKVEVTLPRRLTAAELAEVSAAIRDGASEPAERTYIGYRVTGQSDTSFWATASFAPEYSSNVIGLSAEAYQKLISQDLSGYPQVLGSWLRDGALGHLMVLHKKGEQYAIDTYFDDGSKGSETYSAKTLPGGDLRLERPNDFGEYYIVKADGSLQGWSENGMYLTLPGQSQ